LTDEPVWIRGAPSVDEKKNILELFRSLGGEVTELDTEDVKLCAKNVNQSVIEPEICRRNRIAVLAAVLFSTALVVPNFRLL